MNRTLNPVIVMRGLITVLVESKRSAGHSKWSNIRHIKAEKDMERHFLFTKLAKQMKIAILEGKSNKPVENTKLANVVERAKKSNMPITRIDSILRDPVKKEVSKTYVIDVQGPASSRFVVSFETDQFAHSKVELRTIANKLGFSVGDSSALRHFICRGVILTEVKGDLGAAEEIAINAGIDDVQQIERDGEKLFQFICQPELIKKFVNILEKSYNIVEAEEEYIPQTYINLSEENLEIVHKFYEKLQTMKTITKVFDNIA
ncbi:translational activator of cytochrome c oxidase 1 [Orussus abietinus]|uniref:translational activator of cytochrome c oxidase 1 n=1 Tax=Orussus abietinus TaxID=222816 RepID=UPI0006261455|nr:translational activator of cytochrome c oxidase 1 [Orussus abietinus]